MVVGDIRAKRFSKKIIVPLVLAFVIVALAAGYFGWQFFSLKKNSSNSKQETAARIVDAVGAIYDLPTNEEPTVAQIQDKNKLADQIFFDKSQNGDYVIVYEKAKLALLYREQHKKLVNVGPINTTSDQSSNQTDVVTNPTVTTKKTK